MTDEKIKIDNGGICYVPHMTEYEEAMLAISRERLELERYRDKYLRESLRGLCSRIEKIDAEAAQIFIKLHDRLADVETGLRRLESLENDLKVRANETETQLSDIRECMKGICERFSCIENRLSDVEESVTEIENAWGAM